MYREQCLNQPQSLFLYVNIPLTFNQESIFVICKKKKIIFYKCGPCPFNMLCCLTGFEGIMHRKCFKCLPVSFSNITAFILYWCLSVDSIADGGWWRSQNVIFNLFRKYVSYWWFNSLPKQDTEQPAEGARTYLSITHLENNNKRKTFRINSQV